MSTPATRKRLYKQVDVFTAHAYLGNPLAVVLDGTGLSTEDMQRFAAWTNLSETTFVFAPTSDAAAQGADYQVRIFTPRTELPFAGHPTLGTCHAWLDAGHQPRTRGVVVQQCRAGLVRLRQDGQRLAFCAPTLRRSDPSPTLLAQVASALGLKPQDILAAQHLDNGPHWLGLLLDSPHTVLQIKPDTHALKGLVPGVGVAAVDATQHAPTLIARSNREARAFGGQTPETTDTTVQEAPSVEVRFFAADLGVAEDPVTGSFHASLAQWLIADGHAPSSYVAAQGTCIGRAGRVYIDQDRAGQVWVGGDVVTCVAATVEL